jgi:hypothetical protein
MTFKRKLLFHLSATHNLSLMGLATITHTKQ